MTAKSATRRSVADFIGQIICPSSVRYPTESMLKTSAFTSFFCRRYTDRDRQQPKAQCPAGQGNTCTL